VLFGGTRAATAIEEGRIHVGKRNDLSRSSPATTPLESSFHDKYLERLYADEYDDSYDAYEPSPDDQGGTESFVDNDNDEKSTATNDDDDDETTTNDNDDANGDNNNAAVRGRGRGRGGASASRGAAAHRWKAHHRKDRAARKRGM